MFLQIVQHPSDNKHCPTKVFALFTDNVKIVVSRETSVSCPKFKCRYSSEKDKLTLRVSIK